MILPNELCLHNLIFCVQPKFRCEFLSKYLKLVWFGCRSVNQEILFKQIYVIIKSKPQLLLLPYRDWISNGLFLLAVWDCVLCTEYIVRLMCLLEFVFSPNINSYTIFKESLTLVEAIQ